MSDFAVVIGIGPNYVEIPLLIFPTVELANNFCATTGFVKKREGRYDVPPEWDADDVPEDVAKLLFKDARYYGGCGGCYCLEVQEGAYQQPMVGWDLD